MTSSSLERRPEPSAKDYAYAILKGAISWLPIPIAGGVAAEILSLIISLPISKRQEEWVTSIAQGLVELQEKVNEFSLENLSENESFITTVLHATQVAIRNHQSEKLKSLRNAVLNTALSSNPDDEKQLMYLIDIDELTTLHLSHLSQIRYQKEMTREEVHLYFEGKLDEHYADQILNDLVTRGLLLANVGTLGY